MFEVFGTEYNFVRKRYTRGWTPAIGEKIEDRERQGETAMGLVAILDYIAYFAPPRLFSDGERKYLTKALARPILILL